MPKTRAPAPVFTNRPTDWARLPVTLTTEEVCSLLLCSAEKATSLAREGKIKGIDIGNGYRFDRDSVRAYLGLNVYVPMWKDPLAAQAQEIIQQFGDGMLALYREMERRCPANDGRSD